MDMQNQKDLDFIIVGSRPGGATVAKSTASGKKAGLIDLEAFWCSVLIPAVVGFRCSHPKR